MGFLDELKKNVEEAQLLVQSMIEGLDPVKDADQIAIHELTLATGNHMLATIEACPPGARELIDNRSIEIDQSILKQAMKDHREKGL